MENKRRLRSVWHNMLRRCHYELDRKYKYYGKRGIKVCREWWEFGPFLEWCLPRYQKGLSLDRKDNDKGYSPDNCRFVTVGVNNCNRGRQSNNGSGYIGVTYRLAEKNWEARVRYRGKAHYLGRFTTAEEAVEARNAFIIKGGLPFPTQKVEGGLPFLLKIKGGLPFSSTNMKGGLPIPILASRWVAFFVR